MTNKIYLLFVFFLLIGLGSSATSYFTSSTNNVQYTNPSTNSIYGSGDSSFWDGMGSSFDQSMCEQGTDFVLMIPPAGCEPMVVRSDLLAERNVQVMCQLSSLRINPLIKVSAIKSISFSGKMPEGVLGVSFYPSRAGLRSYNTLEGDPLYNNVGYVVITLKKNPNEATMPKFVAGNLTARVNYDSEKAYGVGGAVLFLQGEDLLGEESNLNTASFWNGKGYLKLLDSDSKSSRIGVYTGEGKLVREVVLKEGETSSLIYFPGFYCKSNFKLKLSELTYPDDSALLNVEGEDVWVRKGSKILNGRCTVADLRIFGGSSGTLKLRCSGAGDIDLSLLGSFTANISVGTSKKEAIVGELVFEGNITQDKKYKWYLGYSEKIKDDGIIVLLGSSKEIKSEVYTLLSKQISDIQEKNKEDIGMIEKIESSLNTFSGFRAGDNLIVLKQGSEKESSEGKIIFNGFTGLDGEVVSDVPDSAESISKDLESADNAVKELVENYKEVRGDLNRLGEVAMLEQIDLLSALGYDGDKIALMQEFLITYSDSSYKSLIESRLDSERNYDTTNARTVFEINKDMYAVQLKSFKAVESGTKKVGLNIGGAYKGSLEEGQNFTIKDISFIVDKIYPNRAEFDVLIKDGNEFKRAGEGSGKVTLRLDETLKRKINGSEYLLEVSDINVQTVAKIELLSEAGKTTTEANFTYKIGIEQRLIKLNPNKSSEKAEKLNKTIVELEKRNAKLAEVIKGLKGACLATNLALNLKNLVTGSSGQSMARQEVMTVWRDYCETHRETTTFGTPQTLDACYNTQSSKINKDTAAYTAAIESINKEIGSEKNITKFVKDKFSAKLIENISTGAGFVNLGAGNLSSWDEIRAYMLYEKLRDNSEISPQLKIKVKGDRDAKLLPLVYRVRDTKVLTDNPQEGGIIVRTANTEEYVWNGKFVKDIIPNLNGLTSETPVQMMYLKDKKYLISLTSEDGGKRRVSQVFNLTGDKWVQVTSGEDYGVLVNSVFISPGQCRNANIKPTVSYYDSGSSKGLAASVPFDKVIGWYVKISNSQGGLFSDQAQGYTSSAIPQTFSICNVGRDLRQTPDDACTSVNINQKTSEIRNIAGCILSVQDMDKLITDAQEALRQAGRQYSSKGKITIRISGREEVTADRGSPVGEDGPIEQCQDFMSPGECEFMFNVCDPVMCPVSRCDLGGTNKVSSVIQSGIIGSLVLCLPNFKLFGGDVYVPICLTGVHAGLEAYTSILKAQRDCLNENAKTGAYVGMCDYMTAIYTCNLFWNQFQPLMSNFLPNIFSALTGKQKAGGGEYMTFQKSWSNMESSLDYFKNTYGKNSFTAFKLGNVQEMGTEVCNAFVGTSFPTTAEALDSLLAPESPHQFYGEFQEVPHTGATVPPTSQYKVFAHIFAGNDQGVSYSIYLKNPPTSSYYAGIPYINVETGFIAKGDQKQVSKDFTAPAGYKELCVSINGNEECGFKQVTTDFGVNKLTEAYRAKQAAQTEITTEKECQQGSASVVGFTSINPQAAVTNVIDPRIDLQGIVRICSSVNPGEGTAKQANWKPAGYCGDKAITCWLDEESVKQSAGQILDVAGTIAQAEKNLELLNKQDGTMSEPASQDKIIEIKKMIVTLSKENLIDQTPFILGNITELNTRGYSNLYQAQAVYWKYKLYEKIVYLKALDKSPPAALSVSLPSVSTSITPPEFKIPSTLGELKVGHLLNKAGNVYEVKKIDTLTNGKLVITIVKKGQTNPEPIISGLPTEAISTSTYSFDPSSTI